jgi:excinuclease ABC subunit A
VHSEKEKQIVIIGAKEHNLKNVSLTIPRNKLVVFTGLSGSGKSSLAFDTLYAEGQRRYLESLSAYARQFLEQMKKPEVESIDGLSPAISIEQKNISQNPRSTVGTVTEIYDFLRLLFARTGTPHCPSCGKPISSQTSQQMVTQIMNNPVGTRFSVLAPIARGKKGEFQKELLEMRRQGFIRAKIDGNEVNLSAPTRLQKTLKHDISIYIDRLIHRPGIEARLSEAVEMAMSFSEGLVEVEWTDEKKTDLYSSRYACADCGTNFPELEPRTFSFNSSYGACPTCEGVGIDEYIDPKKIVAGDALSINEGAIIPLHSKILRWSKSVLEGLAKKFEFSLDTPFGKLPETIRELILFGSGKQEISFQQGGADKTTHTFKQTFQGVIPALGDLLEESPEIYEEELGPFFSVRPCPACKGSRLKPEALFVLLDHRNIFQFSEMCVRDALIEFPKINLTSSQKLITEPILKEILARLKFLENVGLGYLTLSRSSASLSGGEAQRIRLATQIGSHLVGVLYILDEPSIGLHQRDNEKLITTLEQLRDKGNSVIVVEHDEPVIN